MQPAAWGSGQNTPTLNSLRPERVWGQSLLREQEMEEAQRGVGAGRVTERVAHRRQPQPLPTQRAPRVNPGLNRVREMPWVGLLGE